MKNFKNEVFISLGSNLGDRNKNIRDALRLLSGHQEIEPDKLSGLYETEPRDFRDQPRFLNCVIKLKTDLPPESLLAFCQETERALGRVRTVRYGPRIIDLDILTYGRQVIETPHLTVPHPKLSERRFVLEPLCELEPGWRHPVLNATAQELLNGLGKEQQVSIVVQHC
ncbi:MAG: 2-amino-4-hydroxy-6-hydroxymethyldihydropteridine diphosphokinase [Candidatus Euphemobacter frigidus]|nr:2-amino-4-hydroxy-6-hydroxymethyldihydropteridine diphosphokinase [Candidatus Euphemobacter frigidus]MDP8274878.1 2-amino-4-hydroxy-6-hydroxymethyldihydropteridine diphosphokinase [Candidatus Euphemobacter frigidus]